MYCCSCRLVKIASTLQEGDIKRFWRIHGFPLALKNYSQTMFYNAKLFVSHDFKLDHIFLVWEFSSMLKSLKNLSKSSSLRWGFGRMSSSKGNQDGKDQGAGDSPQPAVQFRSCTEDCYPNNYQEPIGILNSILHCGKVDCFKKIWSSEAYRERRESKNEGINFCYRSSCTPLTLAVTAGN